MPKDRNQNGIPVIEHLVHCFALLRKVVVDLPEVEWRGVARHQMFHFRGDFATLPLIGLVKGPSRDFLLWRGPSEFFRELSR